MDRIDKFLDDLEETFAYIREREGGDSVCGLCEYDGAYIGESGDLCNECPGFDKDDCFKLSAEIRKKWTDKILAICRNGGDSSEIPNSSDCISRQAAIDAVHNCYDNFLDFTSTGETVADSIEDILSELPTVQPEEAIPVSWIESRIERFMMAGDAFSGLTASIIRVILNEWEKEQEGGTDDK